MGCHATTLRKRRCVTSKKTAAKETNSIYVSEEKFSMRSVRYLINICQERNFVQPEFQIPYLFD